MRRASSGSVEPPALIEPQYEMLRRVALGEVLPPEARRGLALFLRRGMRGWARTLATLSPSVAATPATSSVSGTASTASRAVIHVFAALAIADGRGVTQ